MSSQIKEIVNATAESTLVVTNNSTEPNILVTAEPCGTVNPKWEIPTNEDEALHLTLETSAHSNGLWIWCEEESSSLYHLHYKSVAEGEATHLDIPVNADLKIAFETVDGIIIIGTADITEE